MFDVWYTPIGAEDKRDLRADIRRAAEEAEARLARSGCAAADYRLSGNSEDLGRICSIHLLRDWRMLVGFPEPDEVCVLLIGRHTRTGSVYTRLYRLLEIDEPVEERDKPACCEDDDEPPVNRDLVDRLISASRAQRRRRRRR